MPGSTTSTRASSRRRSTKAATGRCRRRRRFSKACMTNFAEPDAYPVDGRGVAYSMAFFSAKHLGDGPVLPDDHRGQGRQAVRRRQHLSPERAGERAGEAVLVGDGLRPRHARADPRHAVVEPLVATRRVCRRTPTVRSTSTSVRRPRQARSRTGFRRTRAVNSKCSSASTVPRSRCSTRRGCCRTSSALRLSD